MIRHKRLFSLAHTLQSYSSAENNSHTDPYGDMLITSQQNGSDQVSRFFEKKAPYKDGRTACSSTKQAPTVEKAPSHVNCKGGNMIEISPGICLRLRGAAETHKAIERDFYAPTTCVCCRTTIFCIQDAEYVLCPDCQVVCPLKDPCPQDSKGGIGLGFKFDDLYRWQGQISLASRDGKDNREISGKHERNHKQQQ